MAKKASVHQRRLIADHLAKMLVRYLQDQPFKDQTLEEIGPRIGVLANVLKTAWWQDIPQICNAASLDIGLTIRDQKGSEVTLWPSDNFAAGPKISKVAEREFPKVEDHHRTRIIPHLPKGKSRNAWSNHKER